MKTETKVFKISKSKVYQQTYNAGNCWNPKTCKFVKNGEVFSKSGCSVSYFGGRYPCVYKFHNCKVIFKC